MYELAGVFDDMLDLVVLPCLLPAVCQSGLWTRVRHTYRVERWSMCYKLLACAWEVCCSNRKDIPVVIVRVFAGFLSVHSGLRARESRTKRETRKARSIRQFQSNGFQQDVRMFNAALAQYEIHTVSWQLCSASPPLEF